MASPYSLSRGSRVSQGPVASRARATAPESSTLRSVRASIDDRWQPAAPSATSAADAFRGGHAARRRATRSCGRTSNVPASAAGCVDVQRSDLEKVQKSQMSTKPCMRRRSPRSRAT